MSMFFSKSPEFEQKNFFWLLIIITVAFVWLLWPFFGALFWSAILAMVFLPLQNKFLKITHQKRNLSALLCWTTILLIVILPAIVIGISLIKEATELYLKIQSGELNISQRLRDMHQATPPWIINILNQVGITDTHEIIQFINTNLARGLQFLGTHILSIGQYTFNFIVNFIIMSYLLFFFIRDGSKLINNIHNAIPLNDSHKNNLLLKFATVIRATIKGSVVVSITQGALGGIIFWLLGIKGAILWAVLMAFLSFVPVVGASLIWLPFAIYFLLNDALWQGFTLIFFGVFIIGMADNILRPILVGKDTKMPDYVVLISTLGGVVGIGLDGIIIGPVIAAMFMAIWSLFSAEQSHQTSSANLGAKPGDTPIAAAQTPVP